MGNIRSVIVLQVALQDPTIADKGATIDNDPFLESSFHEQYFETDEQRCNRLAANVDSLMSNR